MLCPASVPLLSLSLALSPMLPSTHTTAYGAVHEGWERDRGSCGGHWREYRHHQGGRGAAKLSQLSGLCFGRRTSSSVHTRATAILRLFCCCAECRRRVWGLVCRCAQKPRHAFHISSYNEPFTYEMPCRGCSVCCTGEGQGACTHAGRPDRRCRLRSPSLQQQQQIRQRCWAKRPPVGTMSRVVLKCFLYFSFSFSFSFCFSFPFLLSCRCTRLRTASRASGTPTWPAGSPTRRPRCSPTTPSSSSPPRALSAPGGCDCVFRQSRGPALSFCGLIKCPGCHLGSFRVFSLA